MIENPDLDGLWEESNPNERHKVEIELDAFVIDALTDYGHRHGWKLDEAIRYLIGGGYPVKKSTDPIDKLMERLLPILNLMPSVFGIVNDTRSCPHCTMRLDPQDIIAGKCSKCGGEL